MQNIKHILASKDNIKRARTQRKEYAWSYYGNEICKALSLCIRERGRLMKFMKNRQDGHLLFEMVNKLIASKKYQSFDEHVKVSYFIGCVKRLY